ncbi:hypothetical protein B5S28_g5124 [[Candida] boidinii]|nr:hypothetical protein B5S28_g5124 [[Candida] boidinii]
MCMRNPTHIYSNGKSTKLSNLNMKNKSLSPSNSINSTDNYKLLKFSQVEYDSSIDPLNMIQYSPKIYKVTKLNAIPLSSDTKITNTNENIIINTNNLPSYNDLYSQSPPSYELNDFNINNSNNNDNKEEVKNLNDIPLPVSSTNDSNKLRIKKLKLHSLGFFIFLWFCIFYIISGNSDESVNDTILSNNGKSSSSYSSFFSGSGCSKFNKMKSHDRDKKLVVDGNTIIIMD